VMSLYDLFFPTWRSCGIFFEFTINSYQQLYKMEIGFFLQINHLALPVNKLLWVVKC
jgi:hypothetical protein